MKRFNKASLLAGTFMAGAMIAAVPAAAQDSDESIESGAAENADEDNFIVVTGSRIQQRNVDTAAPVTVVDAEEFTLTGTVNVENVLNALPSVIPGFGSASNNPGDGTATLDLRGLGDTRTLVLVNGRRWLSFDVGQTVDLNTIPAFLLESVDVVTGGASAVYGSDAIAGVVNFNLKRVEGVEFGGQYSLTERGDGARYQLYGAIGTSFDDGRGNATVFAEYFNREEIFQGDRGFSEFALSELPANFGPPLQQGGSSTLPSGVLRYLGGASGVNGLPEDTEFGDEGASGFGTGVVFDEPGNFRRRANDAYNYAPVNYLQIPQERYLLGGYADYEFTDGHTAYTEVAFVNNRVAQELAATPVTGTFALDIDTVGQFLDDDSLRQLLAIDANETAGNAAFNDAMEDQDPDTPGVQFTPVVDDPGSVSFFVQRRTEESNRRNSLDERNAFRVLGGVRGEITDNLNYDAYYMYSRTRNSNIQDGNISRSAFQAGLDGTGTPINIFGLNTLTDEMVDSISILAQNSDVSTQEVASASINGLLGELTEGGGEIGFAAGYEYRRVGSEFIPDTALASGDVIGFNAGQPTEGAYDVNELFAEVIVPVFDNGNQRLELTGAARYSDYSLEAVGGVWTYAGGAEFDVIDGIRLRGQYQRAIRAPNVGELFQGLAIGFPGVVDPCAQDSAATDATIGALCVATGVPADQVGDSDLQPNSQTPATFGGNPNLEEETSTSWTAGVVLQPTFVPGLTITADYFDIEIEDAIATFGGGFNNTLNLCYNVVQDVDSEFCQAIQGRRVNGVFTVDNTPELLFDNVALLEVAGVDLEVNYNNTFDFSLLGNGSSRLDLNFLGTWTDKNDTTPVQGFDTVIECAGRFGNNCGNPIPKFSSVSRLSLTDGPVTISTRWRHLSGVRDDDDNTDYSEFNGIERINAYDLFDLTLSFMASENLTITAGVNNLFDTLPDTPDFDEDGVVQGRPNSLLLGDNQQQANTYPSVFDTLGRDYFVSAQFAF